MPSISPISVLHATSHGRHPVLARRLTPGLGAGHPQLMGGCPPAYGRVPPAYGRLPPGLWAGAPQLMGGYPPTYGRFPPPLVGAVFNSSTAPGGWPREGWKSPEKRAKKTTGQLNQARRVQTVSWKK